MDRRLTSVPMPAELADEPGWASEIDEAILEGQYLPPAPDSRVPTSRREAEWPMRKLAALSARAAEVTAQADDWCSRIDEWEADELKRVSGGVEYFTHLLERFAVAYRKENPKEATIRLPSGEIATTRPKTPKLSIDNEGVVLAWAQDHLDAEQYEHAVKTTESVLVSKLGDLVSVQKRLVPFCSVCGVALTAIVHPNEGEHVGNMKHLDPGDYDHDAMPGSAWEVLFAGEPVPGLSAELGDVTATVKPAR